MNVFLIDNADREKLTVIIEPWAEEYYLRKNDTLKLQQPDELKGYYHLNIWANGDIQVYVEGEYDYPIVTINDKEAEPFKERE